MSKLTIMNHSEPLAHDSNAAMVQVGWLGESDTVYPLGTPLTEIHKTEPASYAPLYMQLGVWEYNETSQKWYVEQDD